MSYLEYPSKESSNQKLKTIDLILNSVVSLEATYLNILEKTKINKKYGENSGFAKNVIRVLTREI